MSNANFLGFMRRRVELTVEDLAQLLDCPDPELVARYERGDEAPPLEFAMACQVLFGVAPSAMFHGLYKEIEEIVIGNGASLDEALRGRADSTAHVQKRLLGSMIDRASRHPAL